MNLVKEKEKGTRIHAAGARHDSQFLMSSYTTSAVVLLVV